MLQLILLVSFFIFNEGAYAQTKVTPTPVPACTGSGDTTNCCKQNYEQDEKGNPKSGLIRCGRKVACSYQIITDDKGNEIELNGKTTDPKTGATLPATVVKTPDKADMCNFNSLMDTVNRIINFILWGLALPIVAIMFAYAGFTLLTAGGESSHARTKAKSIFFNAATGLVIAFCAYLIISFLLKTLGYQGSWIGF